MGADEKGTAMQAWMTIGVGGRKRAFVRWALGGLTVVSFLGVSGAVAGSGANPRCDGQVATIVGTARADGLVGTNRADVIVARGGNDTVSGLGGNDVVCGGLGKDVIDGGGGTDTIFGDAGDDDLNGGSGVDALDGGAGSDLCTIGDAHANCEREPGVEEFSIRDGVYRTTYGNMRFDQEGTSVEAAYTGEDGKIPDGVLNYRTRTLVGHWIEPRSGRKCSVSRGGTPYWGRLEFTFSADGGSYNGVWGYCDDKPTRGWTATWISQ